MKLRFWIETHWPLCWKRRLRELENDTRTRIARAREEVVVAQRRVADKQLEVEHERRLRRAAWRAMRIERAAAQGLSPDQVAFDESEVEPLDKNTQAPDGI